MNLFPGVLGNRELCARLAEETANKTLSHAYIIEGAKGSGKHTLALRVAAALSCEGGTGDIPCGTCPSCRKILSGRSPDVIYVKKEDDKAQLGVDVIRALREDVVVFPNDLEKKIYIIEDAHIMNVQAQNAFLLTLEEPPSFVHFLLLCETSKPLLDTIKSRAPILRMTPLPEKALSDELIKRSQEAEILYEESPAEFREIVKLSSGYLGQALDLLNEKKRAPILEMRKMAKDFLGLLLKQKIDSDNVRTVQFLPQKREDLTKLLEEIEKATRDLIVLKKSDSAPLCFFTSEEEAEDLSYGIKTLELLGVLGCIEKAKNSLASNANVRLTAYELAIGCKII